MNRDTIGRPMEILLVEDSLAQAKLMINVFRKCGIHHRLTWLSVRNEAIEFLGRLGKFRHAPLPDLILLDFGMPNQDGYEILRFLAGQQSLQTVPVIVITAGDEEASILAQHNVRLEARVTKPIQFEEFAVMVSRLCRSFHAGMILSTAS